MRTLPAALTDAIVATGYFPSFMSACVARAVGDDEVVSWLVHHEATFDRDELHRHATVLVLTPERLVVTHTDDGDERSHHQALSTTESVPLRAVRSVSVTNVVADPAGFGPASLVDEVWLTIGWGAMRRVEIVPASCPDPACDADHGYDAQNLDDDVSIRMSQAAHGPEAVERLLDFASRLQHATGR